MQKKLLGGFAAAALIATPTAAYAEENTAKTTTTKSTAAANQNVSTTSAATSTAQRGSFRAIDLSSQAPSYILDATSANRKKHHIFIAWGGSTELQREALQGIRSFSNDHPNLNIVFIVGPDRNNYSGDIELQFAPSGTNLTTLADHGKDNVESLQNAVYTLAQRNFNSGPKEFQQP